jgi:hypothetical protein
LVYAKTLGRAGTLFFQAVNGGYQDMDRADMRIRREQRWDDEIDVEAVIFDEKDLLKVIPNPPCKFWNNEEYDG